MKKLTFEDLKNYLLINDPNETCTLLSTKEEYIDSKTPLKFRCNQCGKEFERSFGNLRRNEKFTCARCSQNRYLTIEQVKQYLDEHDKNHDCILLSTTYQNYNSYLHFKCNGCGQEFDRKFSQVKQCTTSFKCFDCLKKMQGGYNKGTIEDVQNFINTYDIEHNCELLSTVYVDQYTPLLFKCNCCGKEFERTFGTMKAKKAFKCFRCAHHLPEEYQTDAYFLMINHFRSKLYTWKKKQLSEQPVCDITGVTKDLEVHHLINFLDILQQASKNTGIPLNIKPQDLEKNGYSLQILDEEFIKLHNQMAQGVVLTKNIHTLFHKLYGYKNNTPEQYAEFKLQYQKGELDNQLCKTN